MPRFSKYRWNEWAKNILHRWGEDLPDAIAVDTETTGVGFYDRPFLASVAWEGVSACLALDNEINREVLTDILAESERLVFHNAKFDCQKLILEDLLTRGSLSAACIEDTEALAHLLDEHSVKSLKPLAERYLGETTNEEKRLRNIRRKLKLKKEDGYEKLPREVLVPYARKDAEFTYNLWRLLGPMVEGANLNELYRRELALTLALLDIESKGMRLDTEYVRTQLKEHARRILKTEERIGRLVGRLVVTKQKPSDDTFNPDSPAQVMEVLKVRGLKVAGTSKDDLKDVDDEFVTLLKERRSDTKMFNYFKSMMEEQRDGIIHPWNRQHGTVTGRWSSGRASD